MVALTLENIIFELLPALIVTFVYQLFFRKRRNRFIEAFIIMLYLKTVTFFIYYLILKPEYFSSTATNDVFGWVFFEDFLFIISTSLQEYLIWIMISFFAVLFGLVVLMLKLSLQDPMKRRFSNVIRRVSGKEPETDGYTGLRHRLENISFTGVEEQPLDPDVTNKAYSESWRDYLLIGLVTLLPSIAVYQSVAADLFYAQGVVVFLTWIYRFGYTSSNRIAKGAGVTLGDRDVGKEMMRGVLGWFFRLNLLFSIFTLVIPLQWIFPGLEAPPTILDFFNLGATTANKAFIHYFYGIIGALPPIAFAILVLPLTEDFAIHLYKNLFDSITRTRDKIAKINWRRALLNVGTSFITGLLAIGAFIGAVFAATLTYAAGSMEEYLLLPGEVTSDIIDSLSNATNNALLIAPINWVLLMFIIPFGIMILLGVLGHYIRNRISGSIETFALVAGATVSVGVYILLPGLDYILDTEVVGVTAGGFTIYHLIPFVTTTQEVLARLASQYIINLPLYIFTVLFIMYYFMFRDKWKIKTGEEMTPLLSVHQRDIVDVVVMFTIGIIASIIGIWILSLFMNPDLFVSTINQLNSEIGAPDGLEGYLQSITGLFGIIVEHNIIRTLLMLLVGPVFWSAVLWFVAVKKTPTESRIGKAGILSLIPAIAVSVFWTLFDVSRHMLLFDPSETWAFGAELGYRALIVIGLLVLAFGLIILVNRITGRGSGVWWFPTVISLITLEYFVYDDQFTLIALVFLPMIIAVVYKGALSYRSEVANEDFLICYIRFSLMGVAIAEVLSTALILGGISVIDLTTGGDILVFLAGILPHAVIEIPTFLFAAAASIRVARNLSPSLQSEDWDGIPSKTRELLSDERTWRSYILIIFFLILAAIIEVSVTPIVKEFVQSLI